MKYKTKTAVILFIFVFIGILFCGCRQSYYASHNVSVEADNFNVYRRVTVFNTRTDTVLLQLEALASISVDADNDLTIIYQVDENKYRKSYVHLSNEVTYVVEDIGTGSEVDDFRYQITFLPEKIVSGTFDIEFET